ncbi:MAG: sel1 repeat family protein, partial [Nitrospinae bacterium]|nr:sel1 repeat family protein [Nitrospinota bacterium]
QAYMWETLAAAQGNENASKGLEILEKKMSPAQLTEAQRLAREWKGK